MPAFIPSNEKDTIAARLIDLFTMPKVATTIPVAEDHAIDVELRLLDDKEMSEAITEAAHSSGAGSSIVLRRSVLARAVIRIDGLAVEMPESFKAAFKAETGKDPDDIDQKLWAFSHCQGPLLQLLHDKYNELLEEQQRQVMQIKKKFEERQEALRQEMSSSQPSDESTEVSSSGQPGGEEPPESSPGGDSTGTALYENTSSEDSSTK